MKDLEGLSIPQLIGCDDPLWIIEMTFVNPPYRLDFGKAYLDGQSPYDEEQLSEWRARLKNSFPQADLPRILRILRALKAFGIEYYDARPWNIRLRTDDEERASSNDEDWDKDFD